MEKREDYLRQAKEILEAGGVSVDDFVRYCAEKETTSAKKKMVRAKVSAQNFAFEVMYEGMVRSWVPLEGKKPLGVIFENHLITLRDSPRLISKSSRIFFFSSERFTTFSQNSIFPALQA